MARQKSGDKRAAILKAAITEFASRGVWTTPTSAVSRAAGIADGTLFTYFPTKEVLANELYLEIKHELARAMFDGYPGTADERTQFRHVWDHYVAWGVAHRDSLKVMEQLRVSEQITAESRAAGMAPYAELERLARRAIRKKLIRNHPLPFIGAMFGALADTTMGFVAEAGPKRNSYGAMGFETFWNGIALD
ncbi:MULTISPECIES: TetR/AcrR family transcriptional regulator [Cupriavidus]